MPKSFEASIPKLFFTQRESIKKDLKTRVVNGLKKLYITAVNKQSHASTNRIQCTIFSGAIDINKGNCPFAWRRAVARAFSHEYCAFRSIVIVEKIAGVYN